MCDVKDSSGRPTNTRGQRQREQRRLFWIVALFLIVVGSITITLVYGPQAAVPGMICLLAGASIMGLLWLILLLIERLAK